MNKQEIAAGLRDEIGAMQASIKKVQDRCDRMKKFLYALEAEIEGEKPRKQGLVENTKFRKVIDSVFGEKPRQPKR